MKPVDATYLPPIAIAPERDRPLYRQIYEWLRDAILAGQLQPGQGVPSTRGLAAHLRVSRAPLLVAFELLHAEGYLESRPGARTRVTSVLPGRLARRVREHDPGATRGAHGPRTVGGIPITPVWGDADPWWQPDGAFRLGIPDTRRFPTGIWSSLVVRHARASSAQSTGAMGLWELRVAIADYLRNARDVHCVPAQIMIVAGAQHGMQIAARVLLGRGDPVWMEDPGYWGARAAFESVGAVPVPVPIDGEGMDVAAGVRRMPRARAAYVTPAHQFPMGCTMSVRRRLLLLDWAEQHDAWIVEDDYDSEFRFSGQPISSLQSLDADARVIYIGTFSKVFSVAVRIGYMVIPMDLVPRFCAVRQAIDLASPTLGQLAMADLMNRGYFARHILRLNRVFAARREALIATLARHAGADLTVVGTVAGLNVIGLLPAGIDDVAIARNLAAVGISALPLSRCYLGRATNTGLILGYTNVELDAIPAAARVLAGVVRQAIAQARAG